MQKANAINISLLVSVCNVILFSKEMGMRKDHINKLMASKWNTYLRYIDSVGFDEDNNFFFRNNIISNSANITCNIAITEDVLFILKMLLVLHPDSVVSIKDTIINASKKSFHLDWLSTRLVTKCVDQPLPLITVSAIISIAEPIVPF